MSVPTAAGEALASGKETSSLDNKSRSQEIRGKTAVKCSCAVAAALSKRGTKYGTVQAGVPGL